MAVVFFWGVQLFYQYLFDVRLGATAVEFVVFKRFVVGAIPRDQINRFDKLSFWETAFSGGLGLWSRPFGPYVLLHRDRGFLRRIIVTPRDPDEFCNAFRVQWASEQKRNDTLRP
jgi:hypothetical protein